MNPSKPTAGLELYRHPVLFFGLSLLIPWMLWFIAAWLSHRPDSGQWLGLQSALGLAGLVAPIAVALGFFASRRELARDLAGRILNFSPTRAGWYALTLLLLPGSMALGIAISLLFGHDPAQFTITGQASFSSGIFPAWFILAGAAFLEELAWHSYGTDSLRRRLPLFWTSLVFALYWVLWHAPLSFIEGYYHSNLVAQGGLETVGYCVSLLAFVLLMNWIYYRTGRNVLVAIAFHLSGNLGNELFQAQPESKLIQTALLAGLCVVVLVADRRLFFGRQAAAPKA